MTLTKFTFTDKLRNWELSEILFTQFNLLVGVSGVGKTTILNYLELACNVGLERAFVLKQSRTNLLLTFT